MTGYLDWDAQPAQFKHYPAFLYRYSLDAHEAFKTAALARCITFRSQIGGKPYYRLNTPSAGNLHPTELYVQIRGIEGVIDGIYHLDALEERLVLIQEIDGDGIEVYMGQSPAKRRKGMVFLVSIVPFRAEWKYGSRAYRYCYLDAGHQLGAICAAVGLNRQNCKIMSEMDLHKINQKMGFGKHESACIAVACGDVSERNAKVLKAPMMQVCPVDYTVQSAELLQKVFEVSYHDRFNPLPFSASEAEILERRSARSFVPKALSTGEVEQLFALFENLPERLKAYIVLTNIEEGPPGVYLSGNCEKPGDFTTGMVHMLVDQKFVANASSVVVFTSEHFAPEFLMQAGMFAHYLSLELMKIGLGCTGIGAYYDQKLESFLETDDAILYVCALGAES